MKTGWSFLNLSIAVALGLAVGMCVNAPTEKTSPRPDPVYVVFKENVGFSDSGVKIYHFSAEDHDYLFFRHDRGGGAVHDPKCRCQKPAEKADK